MPTYRLNFEDVSDIRYRYAKGGVTLAELAKEYGTSRQNISLIVRRKTWRKT